MGEGGARSVSDEVCRVERCPREPGTFNDRYLLRRTHFNRGCRGWRGVIVLKITDFDKAPRVFACVRPRHAIEALQESAFLLTIAWPGRTQEPIGEADP
jgi:hypothetical protein